MIISGNSFNVVLVTSKLIMLPLFIFDFMEFIVPFIISGYIVNCSFSEHIFNVLLVFVSVRQMLAGLLFLLIMLFAINIISSL